MLRKAIIMLILCFTLVVLYAQSSVSDYQKFLEKGKKLTNIDNDSALFYLKKANKIAITIKDNASIAETYNRIGYCQYIIGDYKNAEKNLKKTLAYIQESKLYALEIRTNNLLGVLDLYRGDYIRAIQYYEKSINLAEKKNVTTIDVVYAYSSIAGLYAQQSDSIKMKSYYLNAIDYAKKNNFEKSLAEVYNNYGVFSFQNNDSVFYYLNNSLRIAEKYNIPYERSLATLNLAYYTLKYNKVNKFSHVYNQIVEGERLAKSIDSRYLMMIVDLNWGCYNEIVKKDLDLAKNYYYKALNSSKRDKDFEMLMLSLEALQKLYTKQNNYKKALQLYTERSHLKDSINSIQKNRIFQELTTKYEIARKDHEIYDLATQNKLQQSKKEEMIFLGLAVFIPLLVIVFFLRHKMKVQKIIAEQENKLYKQDIESLRKAQEIKKIMGVIEGQELERSRLAKELHDGVASKLATVKVSLSLLEPNNKGIKKTIKVLENTLDEIRMISHDLSQYNILNNNFEQSIKELFNEIKSVYNLNVAVNIHPPNTLLDLEPASKNHIYRIFQELLMNVIKHAKAKSIDVSVTGYKDKISFVFSDDGIGIDLNKKPKGIGLQNIKQRINSLDGVLTINSEKNIGSTFLFEIPKNG